MDKRLNIEDFVLLGRTLDEYFNMFDLSEKLLKDSITLDVASGVSSFCAEANARGFNVTASDKIYVFSPREIKANCIRDLEEVINQLPEIANLYSWNYFKDIDSLRLQRQLAYKKFLIDFQEFKTKRYVPTEYPSSNFGDKQFNLSLVSHFLFLYDEHISYELHKKVLNELIRITSGEVRIFPLANLKGKRSSFVDRLRKDDEFRGITIDIKKVNYEFIKGGNEMMTLKKTIPQLLRNS